MRFFKIALGLLTFLKWKLTDITKEERSRSLCLFPVIGILISTLLVILDQNLIKIGIHPYFRNVILFVLLFLIRQKRQLNSLLEISQNQFLVILLWCVKGLAFCFVPLPLRWITICLAVTLSSGGWAFVLKRRDSKNYEWEDVFWALLICILLSVVCGPLGIFILGVALLSLWSWFRFLRNQLWLFEEVMEIATFIAVVIFYEYTKVL